MLIKKNFPLKKFATMAIGGPARFFVVVKNERELAAAIQSAEAAKLRWVVVGEGSNLIVADKGYEGVVIQNGVKRFERNGRKFVVGAGNNLLKIILKLNRFGLAGMEKMAGIPGTVGGAIYGCAGAYGQEVKDRLVRARIFDGKKFRWISKRQCDFAYRDSVFKRKKDWVIVAAEFRPSTSSGTNLTAISRKIIKLREKKYPPGLRCPGSFFKNIKLADLPAGQRKRLIKKIPPDKIMFGKVPAGYLLDEAGAKGIRQGRIWVASHHANLIYNPGGGKARDVEKLARRLKLIIKKKFGIMLEEEVQYLR